MDVEGRSVRDGAPELRIEDLPGPQLAAGREVHGAEAERLIDPLLSLDMIAGWATWISRLPATVNGDIDTSAGNVPSTVPVAASEIVQR